MALLSTDWVDLTCCARPQGERGVGRGQTLLRYTRDAGRCLNNAPSIGAEFAGRIPPVARPCPVSATPAQRARVSTCGLLLCPSLQRLVQKHVNHIHPRPKLLLCECVHTLDQLLWQPEAEHHATLLLLHVYDRTALSCTVSIGRKVTSTIHYHRDIAICSVM